MYPIGSNPLPSISYLWGKEVLFSPNSKDHLHLNPIIYARACTHTCKEERELHPQTSKVKIFLITIFKSF
jgi:hypothetical protein